MTPSCKTILLLESVLTSDIQNKTDTLPFTHLPDPKSAISITFYFRKEGSCQGHRTAHRRLLKRLNGERENGRSCEFRRGTEVPSMLHMVFDKYDELEDSVTERWRLDVPLEVSKWLVNGL